MTLLFVNRYFHPDHSATSQMLSDVAFALAKRGHDVRVITSRQRYDAPHVRLPARETVGGLEVHRVWTSGFGRHRLVGRAVDYATFYVSAALALWRLTRAGDVIVAKTDPPMLSVVAMPVARMKGAKLVNWLQDLFPEVAEAIGVGRGAAARLAFGALRRLRNRSLRAAAVNVVLGQRMAQRVMDLGVPLERIRIIANWADGTLVTPLEHSVNILRRDWGLADKFVVGYSGNLGRAHEIETMLDAMERLQACQDAHPEIAWLFIGGGVLLNKLEREVVRRNLKFISFQPYQPRERLGESLSAADVHLVSLRPELEGLIVPSKYYGVAAANRAAIFIGDSEGEIANILAANRAGLTVAPGDGEGLARAILALSADPATAREMGHRARRAFEAEFDKSIAVQRWEALLHAVVQAEGSKDQVSVRQ